MTLKVSLPKDEVWEAEETEETTEENADTQFAMVSTVRAPVFGRHQIFGTSEHYGKAHGSLLSG